MRVYERRPANAKPRPRLASSKHFCQAFPNLRSCHRNTPVRIRRRGAARGDRSGGIKALRRSLPSPCFFQFCIERFQWLGRLFLQLWPTPESLSLFRPFSRSAPGQPRARILDLVGSRLARPYHFPARIQSFQAAAAPFPGDSVLPRASRAAIATTETPRYPFGVHIRLSLLTIRPIFTCAISLRDKNYHDTLLYFRKAKSSDFQTETTSRSARDATHLPAKPEAGRLAGRPGRDSQGRCRRALQ